MIRKAFLIGSKKRLGRPSSFTLIELLVVMAIIAILVALTLGAARGLWSTAARSRAKAEIQAISAALEGYKTDNGIYPQAANMLGGTNANYSTSPLGSGTNTYEGSSQILYECLSGKTNYNDTVLYTRAYFPNFKTSQLGNYTTTANATFNYTTGTYVQDPWSYSYGYSTGDGTTNNVPANGANFFDLWSTAGLTTLTITSTSTNASSNAWINNWSTQ